MKKLFKSPIKENSDDFFEAAKQAIKDINNETVISETEISEIKLQDNFGDAF